jgi:polyphosphate kinase
VEALAPVDDPALNERLRAILALMIADDRRAWELLPDDTWQRVERIRQAPGTIDTFATLMSVARASGEPAT